MFDREQLLVLFQQSAPAMNAMQAAENKLVESDQLREKYARFGKLSIFKVFAALIIFFILGELLTDAFKMDEIIVFPALIVIFLLIHIVNKIMMKRYEKVLAEAAAEIERIKADPSLSWLPYNYRSSVEFGLIVGYINNMRAHNLTDAINLLETEMHRARVELNSAAAAMSAEEAAANTRWR